jgi:thiamine biosynthesis protein ThiS
MAVKTGCQPGVSVAENSTTPISIVVNGEERTARSGDTIAALVHALDLDPERLAIELDRRIVKRADWAATSLTPGAKVEIVQFVGGG